MLIRTLIHLDTIEMDRILADPELEAECRRLSHGGSSGMNNALTHYRTVQASENRSISAKGIFARYLGDNIGWALWTRETDNYSFKPLPGHVAFQVYVALEYRRKGIGTLLFKAAQSLIQPNDVLHVYYCSNPNFFLPFKDQGLCRDVYY
jgi:GNAT superfamily N-acetyltransferase